MSKPITIHESFSLMLEDITQGYSVTRTCKKHGVSTASFYAYIDSDDNIKKQYARAREDRGDACIDKIESIQEALSSGKMAADVARVMIDTEKWKSSKFYPKYFGDRQTFDINLSEVPKLEFGIRNGDNTNSESDS